MEIRPILSTLMRHKTAATLIVLEIALTCAIICNALFMIGERITFVNEASGLAEDELVRVQITGIGNDDNAAAQTRTDLAALRGLPGVTGATVINLSPAAADEYGLDPFLRGVVLTKVSGIAASQGFRPGDIIRAVNGRRVSTVAELAAALQATEWRITLERGGREITADF